MEHSSQHEPSFSSHWLRSRHLGDASNGEPARFGGAQMQDLYIRLSVSRVGPGGSITTSLQELIQGLHCANHGLHLEQADEL